MSYQIDETDLDDTFATLGELAENPISTDDSVNLDDDAALTFDAALDCGALAIDLEGARLA